MALRGALPGQLRRLTASAVLHVPAGAQRQRQRPRDDRDPPQGGGGRGKKNARNKTRSDTGRARGGAPVSSPSPSAPPRDTVGMIRMSTVQTAAERDADIAALRDLEAHLAGLSPAACLDALKALAGYPPPDAGVYLLQQRVMGRIGQRVADEINSAPDRGRRVIDTLVDITAPALLEVSPAAVSAGVAVIEHADRLAVGNVLPALAKRYRRMVWRVKAAESGGVVEYDAAVAWREFAEAALARCEGGGADDTTAPEQRLFARILIGDGTAAACIASPALTPDGLVDLLLLLQSSSALSAPTAELDAAKAHCDRVRGCVRDAFHGAAERVGDCPPARRDDVIGCFAAALAAMASPSEWEAILTALPDTIALGAFARALPTLPKGDPVLLEYSKPAVLETLLTAKGGLSRLSPADQAGFYVGVASAAGAPSQRMILEHASLDGAAAALLEHVRGSHQPRGGSTTTAPTVHEFLRRAATASAAAETVQQLFTQVVQGAVGDAHVDALAASAAALALVGPPADPRAMREPLDLLVTHGRVDAVLLAMEHLIDPVSSSSPSPRSSPAVFVDIRNQRLKEGRADALEAVLVPMYKEVIEEQFMTGQLGPAARARAVRLFQTAGYDVADMLRRAEVLAEEETANAGRGVVATASSTPQAIAAFADMLEPLARARRTAPGVARGVVKALDAHGVGCNEDPPAAGGVFVDAHPEDIARLLTGLFAVSTSPDPSVVDAIMACASAYDAEAFTAFMVACERERFAAGIPGTEGSTGRAAPQATTTSRHRRAAAPTRTWESCRDAAVGAASPAHVTALIDAICGGAAPHGVFIAAGRRFGFQSMARGVQEWVAPDFLRKVVQKAVEVIPTTADNGLDGDDEASTASSTAAVGVLIDTIELHIILNASLTDGTPFIDEATMTVARDATARLIPTMDAPTLRRVLQADVVLGSAGADPLLTEEMYSDIAAAQRPHVAEKTVVATAKTYATAINLGLLPAATVQLDPAFQALLAAMRTHLSSPKPLQALRVTPGRQELSAAWAFATLYGGGMPVWVVKMARGFKSEALREDYFTNARDIACGAWGLVKAQEGTGMDVGVATRALCKKFAERFEAALVRAMEKGEHDSMPTAAECIRFVWALDAAGVATEHLRDAFDVVASAVGGQLDTCEAPDLAGMVVAYGRRVATSDAHAEPLPPHIAEAVSLLAVHLRRHHGDAGENPATGSGDAGAVAQTPPPPALARDPVLIEVLAACIGKFAYSPGSQELLPFWEALAACGVRAGDAIAHGDAEQLVALLAVVCEATAPAGGAGVDEEWEGAEHIRTITAQIVDYAVAVGREGEEGTVDDAKKTTPNAASAYALLLAGLRVFADTQQPAPENFLAAFATRVQPRMKDLTMPEVRDMLAAVVAAAPSAPETAALVQSTALLMKFSGPLTAAAAPAADGVPIKGGPPAKNPTAGAVLEALTDIAAFFVARGAVDRRVDVPGTLDGIARQVAVVVRQDAVAAAQLPQVGRVLTTYAGVQGMVGRRGVAEMCAAVLAAYEELAGGEGGVNADPPLSGSSLATGLWACRALRCPPAGTGGPLLRAAPSIVLRDASLLSLQETARAAVVLAEAAPLPPSEVFTALASRAGEICAEYDALAQMVAADDLSMLAGAFEKAGVAVPEGLF